MSKVRKLTVLCVVVSIMAVSFMTNFAFAASPGATKGITDPFPSSKIFYSNNQIDCVYTTYNQLNFRFYGNVIITGLCFVRMETKLGSGSTYLGKRN